MDGHLMSGALDTDASGHMPVQPGSDDSPDEESEEANSNAYPSKAEWSDALEQQSSSETSIKAATSRDNLWSFSSAPELLNAGTIVAPGHNLRNQPLAEAASPASQRQTVNSEAGSSSPDRFHTADDTTVVKSLSSESSEAPAKNDLLPGCEVRQSPAGRRHFVDHNVRSTTRRNPGLPYLQNPSLGSSTPIQSDLPSDLPYPPDPSTDPYTPEPTDLSHETDPLPEDWEKGSDASGRAYFFDRQTGISMWKDPRIWINALPIGVKVHAKGKGVFEFSYKRLGVTKSICESSGRPFGIIAREFEEMKAIADNVLDAFEDPDRASDPKPTVLSKFHVLVIEDINIPDFRELVRKDVQFLGPLIKHISRRDLDLANMLTKLLSAFEKVWGPLPQTTLRQQHWNTAYTWQQGIDPLDFHPFLTFLNNPPPLGDKRWEARAYCRISFVTGPLHPRLLVLMDTPASSSKFDDPQPMDDLSSGIKMPICVHKTREERLAGSSDLSCLLSRLSHDHDLVEEFSADNNNLKTDSTMLWVVVRYAWDTHLIRLRDEIEYTERVGLDEPSVESLRRINIQRRLVQKAAKDIDGCLKALESNSDASYYRESFRALEGKAATLKQDINDATTLLIGAISVMDAGDSRIQARRSTALTALAAIYLPLSLATGVFGMNIWEINKGSPKWWVVVALGLGLLVLSLPFLAWVFIDKAGRTQTKDQSRIELGHDTSRIEHDWLSLPMRVSDQERKSPINSGGCSTVK